MGKEIRITKKNIIDKPVLDWVAVDFVNYCYFKFRLIYGDGNFDMNYDRDCMIIKRVIDKFDSVDRDKSVVQFYIDWAVDRYKKSDKLKMPMRVGILAFWIEDFLGFKFKKDDKKRKRRKVVLTEQEKSWIKSKQSKKKIVE